MSKGAKVNRDMTEEKECFFITPIGEEGSEDRQRSDKVRKHILEKALSEYRYTVVRADDNDNQGSITNKVLQKTLESELVIADLTNRNANVFYELGVRHAAGEPYIQIMDADQSLPVDLQNENTIFYGLDVAEAEKAREDIKTRVEMIEDGDWNSDNPVSRTVNFEELVSNADPDDKDTIELLQKVSDNMSRLEKKVDVLEQKVNKENLHQENINKYKIQRGENEKMSEEEIKKIKEKIEIFEDNNKFNIEKK